MLRVTGPSARLCDGLSRRSVLQIGALAGMAGFSGLTLPRLLAAESTSASSKKHKSVIVVYLSGGLSHQDTFDLKPNAPAEVRGEFKSIPSNVPGIGVCELLPKMARCMDKVALVRSVVGQPDEHSSWMSTTGRPMELAKRENAPHFGGVVAKVQGAVDPLIPPFVDLFPTMVHKPYNAPPVARLGRTAAGVRVDGDEVGLMKNLSVPMERLEDRKGLLDSLDAARRQNDASRAGMDTFHQRAFDVLTSSKLVEALDVSRESVKLRQRYGYGSPKHLGDGAPMWNDQLLMARRLCEAGARVVTVAYGFWDTHGNNFKHLRQHLPLFDSGISALIEDIYARGLDEEITVLVWGEFGRSPKINKDAGRDHWAPVNVALMSGGGMKVGQVIGATDSVAGAVKDDPVYYPSLLASAYRNLGIDPHGMVSDISNRPNPILPSNVYPLLKLHG